MEFLFENSGMWGNFPSRENTQYTHGRRRRTEKLEREGREANYKEYKKTLTNILNVKLQSDHQKLLEELEVKEVTAADLRDLMKTLTAHKA